MTSKPPRPVLELLTSHWVSLLGAALVTIAGASWILVLPLHVRGHVDNPYIGLLAFIFIPVVFFAGLALIPLGLFLAKRRVVAGIATAPDRRTTLRRLAAFFVVMTLVNILIASQVTYRAIEHMETVQFCGQSCHVMKPEFTAHQNVSHQQVACVGCHVEPGATGWVKSKMAGTRQLMNVVFNSYPRPIESAIESNRLAPSVETCEQCHWRDKVIPVRLRIIPKYKDDEANTVSYTVLRMLIGGGASGGIHGAHIGPGVRIRYAAADRKRQTIPWVEYRNVNSRVTRAYLSNDAKQEAVSKLPKYEMQCVDCHNRPTHTFEPADRALDRALAAGEIPALPFVKKAGLHVLQAEYKTDQDAETQIPANVAAFYRNGHHDIYVKRSADFERAGKAMLMVYQRNVFPDLKVTWGTYPNNLGHTDYPGCFRCHDESHTLTGNTSEKKTISQDCSLCHQALAVEESSPEVLKTLGLTGLTPSSP
jgi:nitrate/TMAO reductase-like tetraheme cytochrome c subunit